MPSKTLEFSRQIFDNPGPQRAQLCSAVSIALLTTGACIVARSARPEVAAGVNMEHIAAGRGEKAKVFVFVMR